MIRKYFTELADFNTFHHTYFKIVAFSCVIDQIFRSTSGFIQDGWFHFLFAVRHTRTTGVSYITFSSGYYGQRYFQQSMTQHWIELILQNLDGLNMYSSSMRASLHWRMGTDSFMALSLDLALLSSNLNLPAWMNPV